MNPLALLYIVNANTYKTRLMAKFSRDKIDEAAVKWAKRVVRLARGNLTREKGVSSKTLWNSIRFRHEKNTTTFFMEDYGAFLDKGVSGTGQLRSFSGPGRRTVNNLPVAFNKSEATPEYKFKSSNMAIGGSLKKWLQSKGLPESMDFIIRRSIHARGIRPRRFFSDAWNEMLPEYDVVIGEAATVAIADQTDEILNTLT